MSRQKLIHRALSALAGTPVRLGSPPPPTVTSAEEHESSTMMYLQLFVLVLESLPWRLFCSMEGSSVIRNPSSPQGALVWCYSCFPSPLGCPAHPAGQWAPDQMTLTSTCCFPLSTNCLYFCLCMLNKLIHTNKKHSFHRSFARWYKKWLKKILTPKSHPQRFYLIWSTDWPLEFWKSQWF